MFAQDDWRVTRKLKLNLALRYDYESPWNKRNELAIRGNPGTNISSPSTFGFATGWNGSRITQSGAPLSF
jgi:hypothetical protein